MRWKLFFVLANVVAMLGADSVLPVKNSGSASAAGQADPTANSLLVQTAMQQGRECLARGEYRTAVRVLESQLPKINGNAAYLALLEEAYRHYVKELQQQGQTELAQKYLERLAILDPGVMLTAAVRPGDQGFNTPRSPGVGWTFRGHDDEDNFFRKENRPNPQLAREAVELASKEFQAGRYREAAAHYQRAYQHDPNLPQLSRERWAYCKLHWVAEQLKHSTVGGLDWALLESEVRAALRLAPRLEFGQMLLKTIQERSQTGTAPTQTRYSVKHLSQKQDGWQVSESANFRVYHEDPALAEQVVQIAEATRAAVLFKWLGERVPAAWPEKCNVYLYSTGEAYSRTTGAPGHSPGHSSIGSERQDASRVTLRRIDLRTDNLNFLRAVLPHETTHVTLAGHFGPQPLPRWADEGLAVLSEPPDRIQRHLRSLPRAYQEGRMFTAEQLMRLEDYPAIGSMGSFYSQSVALVSYLTELRGPRTFIAFLRSAQQEGYEAALRRHYGLSSFAELEQQWRQYTLSNQCPSTATAQRR